MHPPLTMMILITLLKEHFSGSHFKLDEKQNEAACENCSRGIRATEKTLLQTCRKLKQKGLRVVMREYHDWYKWAWNKDRSPPLHRWAVSHRLYLGSQTRRLQPRWREWDSEVTHASPDTFCQKQCTFTETVKGVNYHNRGFRRTTSILPGILEDNLYNLTCFKLCNVTAREQRQFHAVDQGFSWPVTSCRELLCV